MVTGVHSGDVVCVYIPLSWMLSLRWSSASVLFCTAFIVVQLLAAKYIAIDSSCTRIKAQQDYPHTTTNIRLSWLCSTGVSFICYVQTCVFNLCTYAIWEVACHVRLQTQDWTLSSTTACKTRFRNSMLCGICLRVRPPFEIDWLFFNRILFCPQVYTCSIDRRDCCLQAQEHLSAMYWDPSFSWDTSRSFCIGICVSVIFLFPVTNSQKISGYKKLQGIWIFFIKIEKICLSHQHCKGRRVWSPDWTVYDDGDGTNNVSMARLQRTDVSLQTMVEANRMLSSLPYWFRRFL